MHTSRHKTYDKQHCFQHEIRIQNLESDLKDAGLTNDDIAQLRIKDFEFSFVAKEEKESCQKIKDFIERHEWLGKMPHRPTHRFIACYKGMIAGAVVMATPNAFSNLLGKECQDLEKLIARGACISWSPKNLGSALIMFAIRWMVKNTNFRVFTAYSDTEAYELGTIYQACNFTYLGSGFGARIECFDPEHPERGWFSDRLFRKADQYRHYADRLGFYWKPEWGERGQIRWDVMPEAIQLQLKAQAKEAEAKCQKREVPSKHKYAYILGRTKSETKRLRDQFAKAHPELLTLPYPKLRGPEKTPTAARPTISAATPQATDPEISVGHLNLQKFERRPRGHDAEPGTKPKLVSVKAICNQYGVSDWTLYRFIKTDPSFPYLNVGLKKKFVIDEAAFRVWMEQRTRREKSRFFRVPSAEELLEGRTA